VADHHRAQPVNDELKSARRQRAVAWDDGYDHPVDTPDPMIAACRAELAREMRGHLTHLSADQRSCIELRFYQDLPLPEVAQRLHRSARAVSVPRVRALRRLADHVTTGDRRAIAS
jgi:RNA polymerase sigma-70 factor (ECF subfamily)